MPPEITVLRNARRLMETYDRQAQTLIVEADFGFETADAVLALLQMNFVTGETIRVDGGRHVK